MRTAAEISADLTVLYAARTALAAGERPDEVSRDGRRMVYGDVTLKELNALILQTEGELRQAQASASSAPSRTAIGTGYY